MKNVLKVLLIMVLTMAFAFSCSNSDENPFAESYLYCVNSVAKTCVPGVFKECPSDAVPKDVCPAEFAEKASSSSSRGSSSSGGSSSSSSGRGSGSSSSGGGSSSSGGQGVAFNENSQVYIYNNGEDGLPYYGPAYTGSGILKIEIDGYIDGYYNEDAILIDAGSVTNGIVNLELPNSIPDEYMEIIDMPPECQASKMFSVESFALTNSNREIIGNLRLRYAEEPNREEIMYLYFSKAGKTICNFEEEKYYDGELYKYKHIINIDAKAGWNRGYMKRTWESSIVTASEWRLETIEVSTNNILTKEIRWRYSPR
jgi:hypothetical protein